MANVNFPHAGGPGPSRSLFPVPGPIPEKAVPAGPSLRDRAGSDAPETLASLAAGPRFERRASPAPELPGIGPWVARMNGNRRPPGSVLAELRGARAHFAGLRDGGRQTGHPDGARSTKLVNPILNAENARNPGLNAVACAHEDGMLDALRALAAANRGGEEGHVRFHLGILDDAHRLAVDAFKHREGGFTLVAVDSSNHPITAQRLGMLQSRYPKNIRGALVIPTPNQAHGEGCRIFGIHNLLALHDFQPYVQGLHRRLYENAPSGSASMGPEWSRTIGNTHVLADDKDAFGVLPGKFFKHIQVPKPKPGEPRTLLDEAEARNPALKDEALNKKGQTLRERFLGQNPGTALPDFSRADRTASLDRKRLVLIDRAIQHYEGLARPG